LGDFRLTYRDRPVDIRAPRMQALLAYLALHPDEDVPRQRLAFLFWPDTTERQARTNLRQLLHRLRQVFPPIEDFLDLEHTLTWRENGRINVDARAFEANLDAAAVAGREGDADREETALERAASLYHDDLLPDCYDAWIEPEREHLRRRFVLALKRLTRLLEEQGEYARAMPHGERLLALDEFDESTYRLLMRLRALNGDQGGALQRPRCITMTCCPTVTTPGSSLNASICAAVSFSP